MDPMTAKYSKSHEWVHVDGGEATIGISDFAVKQLTDLVYIELPPVGKTLTAGEEFGVVESVKAASDLYAPSAARSRQPIAIWKTTSRPLRMIPSAKAGLSN